MMPYLKDPQKVNTKRVMIWIFSNKWTDEKLTRNNSWPNSLRQGDWKLICFKKYGKLELYNLRDDIKEAYDLSEEYPRETKKPAQLLTQKLKRYNSQMPVAKLTGKSVPTPDEIIV